MNQLGVDTIDMNVRIDNLSGGYCTIYRPPGLSHHAIKQNSFTYIFITETGHTELAMDELLIINSQRKH